jgi:hypothetical protein
MAMATAETQGANLLLQQVEYAYTPTPRGEWRRYLYPSGLMFAEYTSHARLGNMPLVHITWGISPETGRRVTARGVIAIGRRAVGLVAIGQLAVGIVAIGQLAIGVLLGLGQATTGGLALGQAAFGALAAVGQVGLSAYITVAQVGYGEYVLAQIGYGTHVVDTRGIDPSAVNLFRRLVGL